jgi:uncharacterized membrane protein
MSFVDLFWFAATVFLGVVSWFRFRSGMQPIGSATVAGLMLAAALAICFGEERIAMTLQGIGIVIAGLTMALNERWKRSQRKLNR